MMTHEEEQLMRYLGSYYGPNAGYALELYERYLQNPDSVDMATRRVFDAFRAQEAATEPEVTPVQQQPSSAASTERAATLVQHVIGAHALAHAIRERGYLGAHLNPLGILPTGDPALLPEAHGITEADLALLPPSVVGGHSATDAANALEAIKRLRDMYSGTISYQFDQVKDPVERYWLRDAVGLNMYHEPLRPNTSRALLHRLSQVEALERYLHQTFPGQKRFSIEGNDVLVPMLDEIVDEAAKTGTHEVIIGMAHRGRLNVLAHVLRKPYAAILTEFEHRTGKEVPLSTDYYDSGWSGDVKYHMGREQVLDEDNMQNLRLILAPNPSHLEFVNPVVEGMARAEQEVRDKPGEPEQHFDWSLPVLIHGDAAFPGEGIVAETLNLWNLKGFTVGGTIHIIVNNQIGFTTEPEEGRSTLFASDLAKGFAIPIIHVNADDPWAAMTATRLAKAYRDRFHKDILIDLIGYRRWGHNEGDEPAFTQPQMYETIRNHPTVRELFARRLEQEGIITAAEAEEMYKQAYAEVEEAKQIADSGKPYVEPEDREEPETDYQVSEMPQHVSEEQIRSYSHELRTLPEGFALNSKLARVMQRRTDALGAEGGIDWGQAEELAFASILTDGTAIRLTGQDVERGTFSHRHDVLHDSRSGKTYIPLQHLPQAKASFAIYNSPISEAAVLGFEYGYSVRAEDALVLWEAQFGDFANVAQVIIDQFVASGRSKWRQEAGLVLLLPHGYEGQGPEHSSARIERYLALSANNNWRIANCSTAGQYFHLLRLQAFELYRDPKPLVVFTPKSLLRNPYSATSVNELVHGTFRPVIDDNEALSHPNEIRRVLLCSGKMAIDLLSSPARDKSEDTAVVRLELLYPFPANELQRVFANYPNMREVVWVQEEPKNMGAWKYILQRLPAFLNQNIELNVIARPEQSSPATGFTERFQREQEEIIEGALRAPVKEYGGTHAR